MQMTNDALLTHLGRKGLNPPIGMSALYLRVAKLSADADIEKKIAADADIESKIIPLYQPTYVEM